MFNSWSKTPKYLMRQPKESHSEPSQIFKIEIFAKILYNYFYIAS